MRLCNVLSKPPNRNFMQIETFLANKKGIVGQQVYLDVGQVALNYYCANCEDNRTFTSTGKLIGIFVNLNMLSIDCVLACGGGCGATTQAWFLIESESDIRGMAPKVRILKRSEKLNDLVKISSKQYGEFAPLLYMAERAHREDFGAGAIVYLRKIYEKITVQTADAINLEYKKHAGGNPKNFAELLKNVDEKCSIIPEEFKNDRYRLFKELSSIVHGECDEQLGLEKFEDLRTLVVGILDNVRRKRELRNAIKSLGWESVDGGVC